MAEADFNIWYKSTIESFLYINERSNIKDEWLDYSEVLNGTYANSIIKPINKYVENLYPKPQLISIENNVVTLEYLSFAEIMLLKRKNDKKLSAMEKVHMRQFYLSDIINESDGSCFEEVYRLFVPWVLDSPGTMMKITPVENSAFKVFEQESRFSDYECMRRIDPTMIHFQFKKIGNHMIDEEYGKISRLTPTFRLTFSGSDIMIKRVKEFYAKG